ncbi:MAG: LD-carboxypeptidase [Lachnospiraceae bacterium]|nr:LD-carboxypeptidase [Lachnospiraceae bacterium]
MIKPPKLNIGDTIATISPAWGCAGDEDIHWKYELGVKRLEELGLHVVTAPNSLKGTEYLAQHPEARAEDVMWAFENREVKAIITNIGGNDSHKLLPYLNPETIRKNPKIFCGYSDVMNLHLYCYQLGLSTFYGPNLLTTVAEAGDWHTYSKEWFQKVFFQEEVIGEIPPSADWSYDVHDYTNPQHMRQYRINEGYERIQGKGVVRGRLFGGHGGLMEYDSESSIVLSKADFTNTILFFEDIPEFCDVEYMGNFFDWLGENNYLQVLKGVIIGKMCTEASFTPYAEVIRRVVSGKYGLQDMPIMYGMNFGHASPICILPYGAEAELDIENLRLSILESGVANLP